MPDHAQELAAQVAAAAASGRALAIHGGGSKCHWLGRDGGGAPLDLSAHSGIVDYEPAELVLTARAGTPVEALEAQLAAEGQMLPFEPARLGGRATLGGTVACNLSGPGRPWRGAARDLLLGVGLIDGRGQRLRFGGRVMKNVAGFDLSRLQAGAMGCLGVLTELSIKVLPLPELSRTLAQSMDADSALKRMNQLGALPSPLSAACWHDGVLFLRLCGSEAAVNHHVAEWGGDEVGAQAAPWQALREWNHPALGAEPGLWRLSVPASAPLTAGPQPDMIDWGGALRWYRTGAPVAEMFALAGQLGGHATLARGGDRRGDIRQPLSDASLRLHQRLKRAFDPARILNPGLLYSEL